MGGGGSKAQNQESGIERGFLQIQQGQLNILINIQRNIKAIEGPISQIADQIEKLKKTNVDYSKFNEFEQLTKKYAEQSEGVEKMIEAVKARYVKQEEGEQPGAQKGGGKKSKKKKKRTKKKRTKKRTSKKGNRKQKGG